MKEFLVDMWHEWWDWSNPFPWRALVVLMVLTFLAAGLFYLSEGILWLGRKAGFWGRAE